MSKYSLNIHFNMVKAKNLSTFAYLKRVVQYF